MKVAVLLATYNGERYIKEQIESIQNQTYKDFHIYISDDNSSDNTYPILKQFEKKYSNITVLDKHESTKSACNNFLYLLETVTADVFLFCDQDDIWHSEHVSILVDEYLRVDEKLKRQPICIHADLRVVDNDLNELEKSFFKYQQLPKNTSKYFYFIQNNVTGCTMLINNCLKELVYRDYNYLKLHQNEILMHDSFFASIANMFGKVIFIDKQIIDYRQHSGNVVGAKRVNSINYITQKLKNIGKERVMLNRYLVFTNFFITYFDSLLSDKEKKVLTEYIHIDDKIKILRIVFLIKNKILKYGIKRNLFLFNII